MPYLTCATIILSSKVRMQFAKTNTPLHASKKCIYEIKVFVFFSKNVFVFEENEMPLGLKVSKEV